MRESFKKSFVLFISLFIFISCSKDSDEKLTRKEINNRNFSLLNDFCQNIDKEKYNAFKEYMSGLSIEEKVSQLFIINIDKANIYIPVEYEGALHGSPGTGKGLVPGGFLFFSYNLDSSPKKIMEFTDTIKSYSIRNNIIPPYLAIDQEGGYVNRLRGITGPLPGAERVTQCLTVSKAYELYSLQAKQMKALGFNLNLAPVSEIKTEENEEFLHGRSFGTCSQVIAYGLAAVNGYENSSIGTVIKHFPGNTNTDPHTGLPEISMDHESLEKSLIPFKILTTYKPSGVLMSHARTKALDSEKPACLSYKWVTEKLINEYGYRGLVFSDDIFMGALAKNDYPPEKASIMAIEAGVNCIMISEKRFAPSAKVLIDRANKDPSFLKKIDQSVEKILEFKLNSGILAFEKIEESIKIVPVKSEYTIEERMSLFNKAKSENVDFYWANFDPQ